MSEPKDQTEAAGGGSALTAELGKDNRTKAIDSILRAHEDLQWWTEIDEDVPERVKSALDHLDDALGFLAAVPPNAQGEPRP